MWRKLLVAGLVLLPTAAGLGAQRNVPGYGKQEVAAGSQSSSGFVPGVEAFEREYPGGQRACIMVLVDRKHPVPFAILVYDKDRRLVAEDHSNGQGDNILAAIWYPPRDTNYVIQIQNLGAEPTVATLVFH